MFSFDNRKPFNYVLAFEDENINHNFWTKLGNSGQSVLSDRRESSEKKRRRALHILQYHSLFYRDNNYKKERRKNKIEKDKKHESKCETCRSSVTTRPKTTIVAIRKQPFNYKFVA